MFSRLYGAFRLRLTMRKSPTHRCFCLPELRPLIHPHTSQHTPSTQVFVCLNGAFQSMLWPNCVKIVTPWLDAKAKQGIYGIWASSPFVGSAIATAVASSLIANVCLPRALEYLLSDQSQIDATPSPRLSPPISRPPPSLSLSLSRVHGDNL